MNPFNVPLNNNGEPDPDDIAFFTDRASRLNCWSIANGEAKFWREIACGRQVICGRRQILKMRSERTLALQYFEEAWKVISLNCFSSY